MNMVEVEHLRVRYGRFEAVRGISFSIPRGAVFGFIGPNGAGKSTTIRVLATLMPRFEGNVVVGGIPVAKDPFAVRRIIGYMPDDLGVYEDLTVKEYLHFFMAAYRLPIAERPTTIDNVMELTDLTHKFDARVHNLSRGMKQRLALARVLLHDPELLLLDEPASGLDPRARIEIRELLKALAGMGKTILVSSHILHELGQLCTQVGIIEAGQLVAQGSLDEIYRQLELTRVIHVQLGDMGIPMIQAIEAISGVRSVETQSDRIAVRLDEQVCSVEDFHDHVHGLGARIRMYQPEAMDMETAFMKLTEGKTA